MFKKVVRVVAVFLWISSSSLFAAGYMVPEQGAGAMMTANAATARGQDASANWFNPAALSQLRGTQGTIGFTYLNIDPTYIGKDGTFLGKDSHVAEAWVPHTYLSHEIHPMVHVGLGINVPFGLVQDWGQNWQGQRIITKTSLQATVINPNIAISLPENLQQKLRGLKASMAFGMSFGFGRFILGQRVNQSFVGNPTDGSVRIFGGSTKTGIDFEKDVLGLGFNTAILLEWKNFSFGLSYRSRIGFHLKYSDAARADFYGIDQKLIDSGIVDQNVNTRLILPQMIMMGLGYKFKQFEFAFDIWWTDWSSFKNLSLDFQGAAPDKLIQEQWHESWAFRGGVKYYIMGAPVNTYRPVTATQQNCQKCGKPVDANATKCPNCGAEFEVVPQAATRRHVPKQQVYVAFGTFYDNTPVPKRTLGPTLPDSDRYGFTFGAGMKYKNFGVDLAFMFLFADDRVKNNLIGSDSGSVSDPSTANGVYKVSAVLIGLSFHLKF